MATKINLGIEYFNDPETGKPLASGQVYIGQVDLDPAIEANRVSVTLVQEDGTSVAIAPAAQPLTIGAGGRIMYSGSPVAVTVDGGYSIKVLDNLGSQIYYVPSNNVADADTGDTGLLVLNGSFEDQDVTAGLPDNWTLNIGENGDIAIDSADSAHGLNSLKFTGTDATGGGTATSSLFDVLKGGQLYVGFTYKSSSATTLNKVQIKYYNELSAVVSTSTVYSNSATNPTSYETHSIRDNVPATAVSAQIILTGVDGSGSIGTTNFDGIHIDPYYYLNPNQASTAQGGSTAVDGADTWAKLAEFTVDNTGGGAQAILSFILMDVNSGQGDFVEFTCTAFSDASTGLEVAASQIVVGLNSGQNVVANDGIKMVASAVTVGTAVEIWVNKLLDNRRFVLKEIAKSGVASTTYSTDAAWQAAEPTGAFEVTSAAPASLALSGDAPATPAANTLYADTMVKAWGAITYSGGGVPSLEGDFNVASLTDTLLLGRVQVNFATAMSSVHYGVSACASADAVPIAVGYSVSALRQTTDVTLYVSNDSGYSDSDSSFIVTGAQ